MKKLTKEEFDLLVDLKYKYEVLSQKRERNVNRYVLPIETKMESIRLKIDKIELD